MTNIDACICTISLHRTLYLTFLYSNVCDLSAFLNTLFLFVKVISEETLAFKEC